MNEKNMVHSSRLGITRTSSSVYGKDFLELVWEKGQILAADNRTQNSMRSSKRAKLSNNNCYKPNEEFHSQETKKPRILFHSSLTATKNSEKQYLGSSSSCDERTRKVINFSNFSIPAVFLKSTSARINASSARVLEKKIEYLKATEEVASTKGSHGFKEQIPLIASKSKPESSSSLADKSVEPASSEALREKGKADDETNLCYERSSSSVCSLEASNNPNFSIRKYEDTDDDDDDDDDSAYLSDDDEETENLVNEKANRIKRSRNAESHSLSERKRRDKIDEKIRTLKDLIPNCNKVDKASMLDDAIDYLKTLKFQLEIMSMGRGLCMPHMMLPNHMNVAAQHLMGFRTAGDGGIPCTPPPPQFPIPPLSSVTDNRLQMFGFSNQMLPPMQIPNAPLFPMIGNTSTQPFNATTIATNLANPGQLTTPEV